MSQEILAVLEHIEREKGIKKEILISAVEEALASAAKKVIEVKPEQDVKVSLDKVNGGIKVFVDDKEIHSIDFGRIAAQTAKQVIIQKIREAEKDVIFTDFQAKIGDIVTGAVYRFEKGNIIVDLLGKAEGLLPRSEQCFGEEFKQGNRIKVYVLDVKRETRGPQIILSRANPNMVRKLFELEIPEIYEGIVEIKSIARDPGERTKISVRSKDEKVDCVGACVGMRGARVKNIVNELHNEKIDIVRFSQEPQEYISSALSPAKISEMKIDKENKTVSVIVDDDQLSLSIGKKGQNVRLASRLTGYAIDIRTKAMLAEETKEKPKAKTPAKAPAKAPVKAPVKAPAKKKAKKAKLSLAELSGVGAKTADSLKQAGYKNVEEIASASVKDLVNLPGVGEKTAAKLIKQAKKICGDK